MEIKINNLSKETVEKLDRLAEKKGISREELLQKFIVNISNQDTLIDTFTMYERVLNKIENRLNENTKVLKEFMEQV